IVEPILAQHGLRRRIGLRTPNIASAIAAVRVTDMVLVAPGSLSSHAKQLGLRELKTSLEFPRHRLQLLWHPRVDSDPGHRWFRELVIGAVGPLRANSAQPRRASARQ
ncbi:MAG: LysR substrate-binding domain-containing protein, partial [Myxococcota bacterium]